MKTATAAFPEKSRDLKLEGIKEPKKCSISSYSESWSLSVLLPPPGGGRW